MRKILIIAMMVMLAIQGGVVRAADTVNATFNVTPRDYTVKISYQVPSVSTTSENVYACRFQLQPLTSSDKITWPGDNTAYCVDLFGQNTTDSKYTITKTAITGSFEDTPWKQATWIYQNSIEYANKTTTTTDAANLMYAQSQVAIWDVLFGTTMKFTYDFSNDVNETYDKAVATLVSNSYNAVTAQTNPFSYSAYYWKAPKVEGKGPQDVLGGGIPKYKGLGGEIVVTPEGDSMLLMAFGGLPLLGIFGRKYIRRK